MNRQQQDLDRYITGNYGEDQFQSDFWPRLPAHLLYWETHNNPHVYEYDPTDDGPEVEIIARIKAAYPITWDPILQNAAREIARGLADDLLTVLAAWKIEESLSGGEV
jgi:hypothetical protein